MARLMWCTQGHRWEIGTGDQSPSRLTCPVCGAAPRDPSLTPPPMPPADTSTSDLPTCLDPPAAQFTDSPASKVGLPLSTPATSQFPAIPGYVIERELGSGGMGVVYQAQQIGLKRPVALKMILAGARFHAGTLARFQTEAETVARLQHPHIVQIYEIGTYQGQPYLALELVSGGSLAQKLRRSLPSFRQAAELLELLARAVQYAHDQEVVHRDLKPGNILLQVEESASKRGEGTAVPLPPTYTHPKIADFGLAKRTDHVGQTRSGDILGTPNYMAPEQAAGRTHEVGPACDVYALGAILYECLVGQPPFQGANTVEILRNVLQLDPPLPRSLQPRVPRDLQTICLTCLHKQPDQRYATAAALAEDLKAFLAGEPIQARPPQGWERIARLGGARRPAVTLGLSLFVVGGAGAALGLRASGLGGRRGCHAGAVAGGMVERRTVARRLARGRSTTPLRRAECRALASVVGDHPTVDRPARQGEIAAAVDRDDDPFGERGAGDDLFGGHDSEGIVVEGGAGRRGGRDSRPAGFGHRRHGGVNRRAD